MLAKRVIIKIIMSVYTKTGDKGETGLFDRSKRLPKHSLEFEVLGTIDEANSALGLAISFEEEQYLKNKIIQVQRNLFKLGSMIAGARLSIPAATVKKYEREIDAWEGIMPVQSHFIFPGGSKASSFLYSARTVVRRLERLLVKLSEKKEIPPGILIYVNRLSDYLYVLARYINFRRGVKENFWKGRK